MKTFNLPEDHKPYIDKYFLRSKEILKKDRLNPEVTLQVFMRNGNCKVHGINEALAILDKYAKKVKVWSLKEGSRIAPCETVMLIQAPVQRIIDLETMYLGVISAETTIKNDWKDIDLRVVEDNMREVVEVAKPRPVMYFGARHWRWDRDAEISKACFKGGASDCSTDIGAGTVGKRGVGTIPHALEAVYHWKYGMKEAVWRSIEAFDNHMDKKIPRVALVDYANREVLDSLWCSHIILRERGLKSFAIRIDTCGENFMQGVAPGINSHYMQKGVSVYGVYLVRRMLYEAGYNNTKIVLSSGFADSDKIKLFIEAEKRYGVKLFNSLGVGQVFYSRTATGDIVKVEGREIHKVGRPYRENKRLRRVM